MKINFKKKKYWDVAQISSVNELYPDKNRMKKAIVQLFNILQDYIKPEYFDNPVFSSKKSLSTVFPAFLKILDDLNVDFSFSIEYDGNYYIKYCHDFLEEFKIYPISIDFMPLLYRKNRKLYNIMKEVIRLNVNECKINTGNQYEDWTLEDMQMAYEDKDGGRNKEERKNILDFYEYNYDKYCKILNQKGNAKKAANLISKYNPQSTAESLLLSIAKDLLNAYNTSANLFQLNEYATASFLKENDLDINDENLFGDGPPVELDDLVFFNWFSDTESNQYYGEIIGENAGNFGNVTYVVTGNCYSKEDVIKSMEDPRVKAGDLLKYYCRAASLFNENLETIYAYCNNKLIGTLL